ncbi:MAG: PEP-CTERM sorting domain-containing protein [Kiritimatiellae bacterium]|nr:PEP-CTERM sorting domain-containing protein [Kiritimatiellia bacterium]
MNRWRLKQKVVLLAILGLAGGTAHPVLADLFLVDYTVTINIEDGGTVFGESGSVLLNASYLLDTDAAPVILISAGTSFGEFTYPVDWYGYDASAVSALTASFGTKTWEVDDIELLIPEFGIQSHVWFDAPLVHGATPNTWLTLSDDDGDITFGGSLCGSPNCELQKEAIIIENTLNDDYGYGSPLTVTITAVPEPRTISLLLAATASLYLARRKTSCRNASQT